MSYEDLDKKAMMLGSHEARLDALEESTKSIATDVKAILAHIERAKGSWKTLVALGGVMAAVVEAAHWIIGLVTHK